MGGALAQSVSVEESGTFKNWKCKNMLYLMNIEKYIRLSFLIRV